MRALTRILGVAVALMCSTTGAQAQAVKNGGPNGIVISQSVVLNTAAGSYTAVLNNTESTPVLITQICVRSGCSQQARIGTAVIPLTTATDGPCDAFVPGLPLPPGEDVEVQNTTPCCLPNPVDPMLPCVGPDATVIGVRTKK